MERGYVKLWRSIDQNELLENDNTALIVFIKLLTRVNRLSGAYTTGRYKLANICNMNPSTLYSALKRLEASTIIQQQSNTTSTTITICNWWEYQQDVNSSSSERRSGVNTKQEKKENIDTKVSIMSGSKKEAEILAALNKSTGRNFRTWPSESRTRQTPKQFTADEVTRAIERMKLDEWHKPRIKQLSAGYLLATSTIDKFLNYETKAEASIGGIKAVKPIDDREQYRREFGER